MPGQSIDGARRVIAFHRELHGRTLGGNLPACNREDASICSMLRASRELGRLYERKMKLISWNVNGLRAVLRKNFLGFLAAEQPDILCLQETKAGPDDV